MKLDKFTILIPAHNSLTTIQSTLNSINLLNADLIEEIIYIDDNSTDGSLKFVREYFKNHRYKYQIIFNKIPQGLAKNYNYGIGNSKSKYLITMHQDIEITDSKSLEKIIETFETNKNCVLVSSNVEVPRDTFKKYNFWMKVNYSRQIDRVVYGYSGGKFDAIDLSRLDKKFYFNDQVFKNSGEDIGFSLTLKKYKLDNCPSGVLIYHNHNFSPNYSFADYIKKENQFNETYGVVFRNYGIKYYSFKDLILMFHRLIIVCLLFIPYVNLLIFPVFIFYLFYYSKNAIFSQFSDRRVFLIPFANIVVVFLGAIWNIIGFITGKQTI